MIQTPQVAIPPPRLNSTTQAPLGALEKSTSDVLVGGVLAERASMRSFLLYGLAETPAVYLLMRTQTHIHVSA